MLYMTAAAAREAHISESTLRMWARLGIVPSERTSTGVHLFKLEDVLRVAHARSPQIQPKNEVMAGVAT